MEAISERSRLNEIEIWMIMDANLCIYKMLELQYRWKDYDWDKLNSCFPKDELTTFKLFVRLENKQFASVVTEQNWLNFSALTIVDETKKQCSDFFPLSDCWDKTNDYSITFLTDSKSG